MGLVQWKHCAYLTAGGGLSGGSGLGGGGGLQARVSDLECHHVKQKVSRHAGANWKYTTGSRCHCMQVAAARAGSARHCAGLQAHFKTMGIQTACIGCAPQWWRAFWQTASRRTGPQDVGHSPIGSPGSQLWDWAASFAVDLVMLHKTQCSGEHTEQ